MKDHELEVISSTAIVPMLKVWLFFFCFRNYLFIRDSESIVDFLEVNGWFTLGESFEPAVSLRLVKHHVDRKS